MPHPPVSFIRLTLCCALAVAACTSSSADDETSSSSATDGTPMPQPMFHPSCEEPSASTAITCDNFCDKLSLCLAGLCAEQRSEPAFCEPEVAAEAKASCMDTCDSGALQEDADNVSCLLENTCSAVFVDKACDPSASLECGGLPNPGTSSGTTGSGCEFEFDGVCDEPEGTGLCLEGTDPDDCSGPGTGGSTGFGTGFGTTGGTTGGSTGFDTTGGTAGDGSTTGF